MPATISAIANHSLDTSSIEKLAQNLSDVLQATVTYGYDQSFNIDHVSKTVNTTFDFHELGTCVFENAKQNLQLTNDYIGFQLFLDENGQDFFETTTYDFSKYTVEEMQAAKNAFTFELTDITNRKYDTIAYIYKHFIDLWNIEYLERRMLQYKFVYRINDDSLAYFYDYRTNVRRLVYLFGGDYVFFFSDEDKSHLIDEWALCFDENQVFDKVQNTFSGRLVNIAVYMATKSYADKPKYVSITDPTDSNKIWNYARANNIEMMPNVEEYPLLYYDDFSDLEGSKKVSKRFDFVYDATFVLDAIKKNEDFQNSIVIPKPSKAEFKKTKSQKTVPFVPDGHFRVMYCQLAGLTYYKDMINLLHVNTQVFLVREPQNKFDKRAIALYIDIEKETDNTVTERQKIGYINRYENEPLQALIDNGFEIKGFISKIISHYLSIKKYEMAVQLAVYMPKKITE